MTILHTGITELRKPAVMAILLAALVLAAWAGGSPWVFAAPPAAPNTDIVHASDLSLMFTGDHPSIDSMAAPNGRVIVRPTGHPVQTIIAYDDASNSDGRAPALFQGPAGGAGTVLAPVTSLVDPEDVSVRQPALAASADGDFLYAVWVEDWTDPHGNPRSTVAGRVLQWSGAAYSPVAEYTVWTKAAAAAYFLPTITAVSDANGPYSFDFIVAFTDREDRGNNLNNNEYDIVVAGVGDATVPYTYMATILAGPSGMGALIPDFTLDLERPPYSSAEPYIASRDITLASDGRHYLVASWEQEVACSGGGVLEDFNYEYHRNTHIIVKRSYDGGNTWTPTSRLYGDPYACGDTGGADPVIGGDPSACVTGERTEFIAYHAGGPGVGIFMAMKEPGNPGVWLEIEDSSGNPMHAGSAHYLNPDQIDDYDTGATLAVTRAWVPSVSCVDDGDGNQLVGVSWVGSTYTTQLITRALPNTKFLHGAYSTGPFPAVTVPATLTMQTLNRHQGETPSATPAEVCWSATQGNTLVGFDASNNPTFNMVFFEELPDGTCGAVATLSRCAPGAPPNGLCISRYRE